MKIKWEEGSGATGVSRGRIDFGYGILDPYRWPLLQITGAKAGPRLCVTAGVHVTESSSMAAAVALVDRLDPAEMTGSVSIIPLVNQPAEYRRMKEIPIDNKNIHEVFPGRADGTFSEVLAHALLHDWAADADVLIDLHSGDFGHHLVNPFVVIQKTSDEYLNRRNRNLVRCFQPSFLVYLDEEFLDRPGRICSARARDGKPGMIIEAGANGAQEARYVDFHLEGLLNVAGYLGILPNRSQGADKREPIVLDQYLFVSAPVDGFVFPLIDTGDHVEKGQVVAIIKDDLQRPIAEARSPADGYVTWRTTQILAKAESRIIAMGRVLHAGKKI